MSLPRRGRLSKPAGLHNQLLRLSRHSQHIPSGLIHPPSSANIDKRHDQPGCNKKNRACSGTVLQVGSLFLDIDEWADFYYQVLSPLQTLSLDGPWFRENLAEETFAALFSGTVAGQGDYFSTAERESPEGTPLAARTLPLPNATGVEP